MNKLLAKKAIEGDHKIEFGLLDQFNLYLLTIESKFDDSVEKLSEFSSLLILFFIIVIITFVLLLLLKSFINLVI